MYSVISSVTFIIFITTTTDLVESSLPIFGNFEQFPLSSQLPKINERELETFMETNVELPVFRNPTTDYSNNTTKNEKFKVVQKSINMSHFPYLRTFKSPETSFPHFGNPFFRNTLAPSHTVPNFENSQFRYFMKQQPLFG